MTTATDLQPDVNPSDLDAFTMFSSGNSEGEEHDPILATTSTMDPWLFRETLQDKATSIGSTLSTTTAEDPLDTFFSVPVQEFLMREQTPETVVSSASELFASSKGRSLFGLSREDSLLIAQQIISGREESLDLKKDLELAESVESSVAAGDRNPSPPPLIQDPQDKSKQEENEMPSPPSQDRILRKSSKPSTAPPLRSPSKRKTRATSKQTTSSASSASSSTVDTSHQEEVPATDIRGIDVLFGKGGKINKHIGNLHYHTAKKNLQKEYLHPNTTKLRKRELVRQLYDIVIEEWGGRFLRRVGEQGTVWFVAPQGVAMEKCRQALATPERTREERAARRRMFLQKRKQRLTTAA